MEIIDKTPIDDEPAAVLVTGTEEHVGGTALAGAMADEVPLTAEQQTWMRQRERRPIPSML